MIRNPRVVLALLTALNLLNYVDRYVLSAVLGPMQAELQLRSVLVGLLSTTFLIGYFATSPVFGALGDRTAGAGAVNRALGPAGDASVAPSPRGIRRWLMATGVAVWSAATVGTGLAQGTASLVASRALVGVGEASYGTLAPTVIDDVAPAVRATQWMAFFSAAMPIGAALGYVVGGAVLKPLGWRAAFWVVGIPGFVLAVLCMLLAEPVRRHPPSPASARDLRRDAEALFRVPLYLATVLGYCAYTFAIGGFAFWAPHYLHVRYAYDAGAAAKQFGTLTLLGGLVGTLAGGWIADRLAKARMPPGASARDADEVIARVNVLVCGVGCAVGAPLAAACIAAPSAALFFVFLLPCQVALFALNGPINVAVLRSAPPHLRASAMAVAIFAIHALGDLWSPPIIGFLSDSLSMQAAMVIVPVVFALAAVVWWRGVGASGWVTVHPAG